MSGDLTTAPDVTDDGTAKVARRKANGYCVCCGVDDREQRLACDCWFCALCVDRGHADHSQPYAVPCVEAR